MVKRNLKKGTKCVIVGNNSRHNQPIGTIVKISGPYNNQGYTCVELGGAWFAYNDLEVHESSKEDLLDEYESIKSEMMSISDKLTFLEENKKDTLIIKEYKEYVLGKIIDSKKGSSEEKSKAILEIVESVDGSFYSYNVLKVIKLPKIEDVTEDLEKEEFEDEDEGEGGFGIANVNHDQGLG